MPVLEFHLTEYAYTDAQCDELMVESSRLYADVLRSPIERVRVFIHLHKPTHAATGGVPISRGGKPAPCFFFLMLQGRPIEEKHALLAGFTDLVVRILGTERSLVRGGAWMIPPEDWSIGGTPASVMRAAEVKARADAEAGSATAR